MIIPEETRLELVACFSEFQFAHLQLPDGWFGRPWDNQHELTYCVAREKRLLVELDHHLLLVFDGPLKSRREVGEADADAFALHTLVLDDFAQCVFDQREYGSDRWHVRTFEGGSVRLLNHATTEPAPAR